MKTKIAVAVAVALVAVFTALSFSPPKYFDDKSPVMYFYSEICSHCVDQKPILSALADEGFRVKSVKLQGDEELFRKYSVEGTPTFVAANGDRLEGLQQKDTLRSFLLVHGAKIA